MENRKVVLAIDDDPVQLQLFQRILSTKYDIQVVKSASNALNFLNTHTADIILLDILMPNISGFEFLDDIRKIPSYVTVPIIIVSSDNSEAFFKQARNSSAFDVLTKPVAREALIATIEKAFAATG